MEKILTLSKTIKLQYEILNYHHTVKVDRGATLKDGIRKLSKPSRRRYLRKFSKLAGNYSFCNFIPASGSGSRLFAHLINFCKNFDSEEESFSNYVNRTKSYPLHDLFVHIKNFSFYNDIPKDILYSNGNSIPADDRKLLIARYLIEELEIHKIPKALQLFHEVDKQYNGREIKFLEQPGLWNGGMHDWLTVFVEIDKNCFNPVKKIEDLLSENHQSN